MKSPKDGFLDEHVKTIRQCYKERRDAMLAALNDLFPPEVKWTHPQGGLFLWVTLPAGVNCMRLFDDAIKHDVAFVRESVSLLKAIPQRTT